MPTFDDLLSSVDEQKAKQQEVQKEAKAVKSRQSDNKAVLNAISQAVKTLIAFEKKHQPKVEVTTPDVQAVVKALEALKQPLQENKPDNSEMIECMGALNESISKLPIEFPQMPEHPESVAVSNHPNMTPEFDKLGKAIKSIDVKPVVNIPEAKPADYGKIIKSLSGVVEAVQAIKIPEAPKTDLSPLVKATSAVQKSIEALRFPVPNYVLPFMSEVGKGAQVKLTSTGAVPVSTKTALTPSAPTFATVDVASAQALAANTARKGAIFCNTSANTISIGIGVTAVLNSGITLYPGGTFEMMEYNFSTGVINAISDVAASNLAIQEYS